MKKHKFLLLTILWMIFIFYMSHQDGTKSGDMSGSILTVFLDVLAIPSAYTDTFHLLIRKVAHMSEYAILTLLIYNALPIKTKYRYAVTATIAVVYACSDEFHQYFIPGRAALVTDVMIDSIGIGIMLLCIYGYQRKQRSPE